MPPGESLLVGTEVRAWLLSLPSLRKSASFAARALILASGYGR